MRRIILPVICAVALCGCHLEIPFLSGASVPPVKPTAEAESESPHTVDDTPGADEPLPAAAIQAPEPVRDPYTVFVENRSYRLGLYETPIGAYLGAYILSDPAINYDLSKFERATGKSHALYSYYTSIGGNFPITWFLSCLAEMKTPNMVVKTPGLDVSDAELEQTARELGEFYVPMFVQLAPVESRYDPEKYKAFFRRAREIFREYASNAAVVWTVKAEDAFDCMKFYPGDAYVDWVGISVYETFAENKAYDPGNFRALDHFYYSFQKTKPIMLTEYAVSHYSSVDAVYRNAQAAAEITRVYTELSCNYPRIKAVTYMDVNGLTAESNREVRDNFALLEEKEVLAAYSAAVDTGGYLSQLDIRSTGDLSAERMKSPFPAYKIGEEIWLARATVEQDLNISGAASRLTMQTIDGREYCSATELQAAGLISTTVDTKKKTAVLKRVMGFR